MPLDTLVTLVTGIEEKYEPDTSSELAELLTTYKWRPVSGDGILERVFANDDQEWLVYGQLGADPATLSKR